MLHPDDIEAYRRMTPDQKLREWRALVRSGWKFFDVPDPETGKRKWAAWEREHRLANESVLRILLERDREPAA